MNLFLALVSLGAAALAIGYPVALVLAVGSFT